MRLLDFVEQHYRVRCALHALGKLSALFVAYVSRRRTDQLRNRVLLHELGHIEADQSLLNAQHELRERPRYFRLADAGRTEKQKWTNRPLRCFQAGTAAAYSACKRGNCFILRNAPLVE